MVVKINNFQVRDVMFIIFMGSDNWISEKYVEIIEKMQLAPGR